MSSLSARLIASYEGEGGDARRGIEDSGETCPAYKYLSVCVDVCASLDAHEAAYSQAPPSTLLSFLGQSLLKLQGNLYFRNFHLSCAILKQKSAWA